MPAAKPLTDTPPRRGGRRRRLLVAGLLLVAASAGLWAWAAWRLSRDGDEAEAVAAELDRLDPGWRLEDLEARRDHPPDAENGALKLLAVAAMLPEGRPIRDVGRMLDKQPPQVRLGEPQLATVRAVLKPAEPALAEARQLPRYTRSRFPAEWKSGLVPTVAAWLRADSAVRAEVGDQGGALEGCRGVFHAARMVGDEPSALAQGMRAKVWVMGVQLLERLLAQGEPPADGLAELQRRLRAEEPAPLELTMLRAERAIFDQAIGEYFASRPAYERWAAVLTPRDSPARVRAAGLRYWTRRVEIAKLPAAERPGRRAELAATIADLPGLIQPLIPWSLDAMAEEFDSGHALMRCATAAIAAERFRRDTGRWPASLEELVTSGLLPAVPADPHDLQPLRLKRWPDGLVIYSVGPDGKDDGGALNRQWPFVSGDLGLRLWDVNARRQSPAPPLQPSAPKPAREDR
jgi:hypothetical protein